MNNFKPRYKTTSDIVAHFQAVSVAVVVDFKSFKCSNFAEKIEYRNNVVVNVKSSRSVRLFQLRHTTNVKRPATGQNADYKNVTSNEN